MQIVNSLRPSVDWTTLGSDNGLSPARRQAIIWTNYGILLIWPLGTTFSEISIEILIVSFKKMRLKGSPAKWWSFCHGVNVNLHVRVLSQVCHLSLSAYPGVCHGPCEWGPHHSYVIMSAMVSQITGVTIVYSTVCSGADQRKHQSSASLAFVRGIHRWPVNSPHKGSVTQKMFPFDDVIMIS